MNPSFQSPSLDLAADSLNETQDGMLVPAACLALSLPSRPRRFYRHGWHSWTLACWLDPSQPPLPIRSPQFRAKDEDPLYAFCPNHISAWVGAVELDGEDILLVGALSPGGRVELTGTSLRAFYEHGERGEWLITRGPEEVVFEKYAIRLRERYGQGRYERAPRVWCSWYSLYKWVNEPLISKVLNEFGDLPFDVLQIDDGWQDASGHWEAGRNFPGGMAALAAQIRARGRIPGLWLSPFIVTPNLTLFHEHPDWLLRDESGRPVKSGLNWSGQTYALDVTHPAVLSWLEGVIRKVVGWGYGYLKLDFLYAGALPGKHYQEMPRELAYRQALKVMREAASEAYILACGAPLLPSLGLCDGLRIGPDVTPYWLNRPLSVWLNNPNHASTQNAIRTSLHRLWLAPLVHTDPDVVFFRSKHNRMSPEQKSLLRDLAHIAGFKATSDLPQWLSRKEREALRRFLERTPEVRRVGRYQYHLDGRAVDFRPVVPLPASRPLPAALAQNLGLLDLVMHEALPALWESRKRT